MQQHQQKRVLYDNRPHPSTGKSGMVFSGAPQQNFAGASLLLAQLLPQKPRQQSLRFASIISDAPAKSLTLMILTCQVKKGLK
jgi:hypothetical protein